VAGLRGRPSRTIPAVGLPGELVAMSQPGSLEGYRALFADNPDAEFHNEVAARVALRVGAYRPVRNARRLRAALLVVVAGEDEVTPPRPALPMAELAPRGSPCCTRGRGTSTSRPASCSSAPSPSRRAFWSGRCRRAPRRGVDRRAGRSGVRR
jgi:uncharacterized protein